MKITFAILFLFYFTIHAQQTFEGTINFKTEILKNKNGTDDLLQSYKNKYGDSLVIYYSKTGDFKRKHINTGLFGLKNQYYKSKSGILYFIYKNNLENDSLDVKVNKVKLISKSFTENEIIMGLDCKCITYTVSTQYDYKAKITYCYNESTPVIDDSLFVNHKDFFLDDYFKISKRPYLKYTLVTPELILSYTAIKIKEEDTSFEISNMEK